MQQAAQPEQHVQSIDEAAVDKFFESGGQELEAPIEDPVEAAQEHTESQAVSQQAELSREAQEQENYKAAMNNERRRRQEVERIAAEQAQQLQQIQQEYAQTIERIKKAQEAPAPTFDEDPLGALAHQQEQLRKAIEYQQQVEVHRLQQEQMAQNMQRFQQDYAKDAMEFMQNQPDFRDAYRFLAENRLKEFQVAGWGDRSQQMLIEDEMAIVANARQAGVNPAQYIYELAKFRGFNSSRQQPAKASAQEQIKDLARAKESALSLSNTPSSSGATKDITLEALLAMDDGDEFDKGWAKFIKQNS